MSDWLVKFRERGETSTAPCPRCGEPFEALTRTHERKGACAHCHAAEYQRLRLLSMVDSGELDVAAVAEPKVALAFFEEVGS